MKKVATVLFRENPFGIIIITPIMKRAHQLNFAKEIIFVDSTSACDPLNHAITFIMCPSAAGAIPLAIIVTKGQTYESYCQGFSLLKEAVPESFCGQGFPNIFITDQSAAEINAINYIWPKSSTLLCVFHVLQAVWRWLWDSKHNIPLEKRKILIKEFRTILYSESIVDAEHAYLKSTEKNLDCPNWISYIQNYWSYRQKWCLCFRDHTSRGHVTNNYCEVAVRLFKDHVLCRVKAYNVLALIDLTCTALENYYKHRLREFSDSRNSSSRLFLQKMIKKTTYLKKEMIIQESDDEFLVPSEEESGLMYYVDTNSGLCSCSAALTGTFCKHQCAVYKYFGVKSEYCPVITPTDRFNIAKIAYGDKVLDESFYEPFLKENNGPINYVEIETIKEVENNVLCNESCNTEENRPSTSRIENDDDADKKTMFENLLKMMNNCHENFGSSSSGILKLEERLKKIKTEGQWETFLHTAGQQVALKRRDGAMIKVQPTSIARRSAKVTKGSKRLLAGRPPSGEKTMGKRKKRNLGLNINLNQTNAKSHGPF